jgi:beta-lactamase superfamily II metal-dependent hydrolase
MTVVIALIAFIWAWFSQQWFGYVITLWVTIVLWHHKQFRSLWVLVSCLFGLIIIRWLHSQFPPLTGIYWVTYRRDTWMQVSHLTGHYFVRTTADMDVSVGDLLIIQGSPNRLNFSYYESMGNFRDYLMRRGMQLEIHVETLSIWRRYPFRLYPLIQSRFNTLPIHLQWVVSEMLVNQPIVDIHSNVSGQTWLGVTGLTFYMCWQGCLRMIRIYNPRLPARFMVLIAMIPYGLIMWHQPSIIRVFAIEAGLTFWPHLSRAKIKQYVLIGLTMVNPYYWLEMGGITYGLFLVWHSIVAPVLPRWLQRHRWVTFSSLQMLRHWLETGLVIPFKSWLFFPEVIIQAWLFIPWLLYVYTGWRLPGLVMLTELYMDVFLFIQTWSKPLIIGQPFGITLGLLIILGICGLWLYHRRLHQYQPKLAMMTMVIMVVHLTRLDQFHHFQIHFINVGQGDATLIQAHGINVLIDTGGQRHVDIAEEVLIPYFHRYRVRKLDYVIITHPDFDHDGALPSLETQLPIHQIIRDPFISINLGRVMLYNYQHFRELMPEDNDRSLIIGVVYQGCQFLIMGDASVLTETYFLANFPEVKASILRVGHHGSSTSTSPALLTQLESQVAIISVGGTNRYGHPHQEVLKRLQDHRILTRRTDLEGTIRYQTCKI